MPDRAQLPPPPIEAFATPELTTADTTRTTRTIPPGPPPQARPGADVDAKPRLSIEFTEHGRVPPRRGVRQWCEAGRAWTGMNNGAQD